MRTNITISLDPGFLDRMDAKRGAMARSRWIEAQCDPQAAPVIERSPVPSVKLEEPREPVAYVQRPAGQSLTEREIRRQEEAGEA